MKRVFLIFLLLYATISHAQSIPLDQQVQKRFNEMTLAADTSVFTGFRSTDWLEYTHILSKQKTELQDSIFGLSPGSPAGYALQHLTDNNWIQANGKNSVFAIDPYIEAMAEREKGVANLLHEISAGVHLQGVVSDKLSYSAAYIFTNDRFPNYLDSAIKSSQGYGLGMGRGTLNSNGSYNFQQFTGNILYQPSSHFLISIGNGKFFLGDGYRSLLLSDNSSNYPYIRLQARFWRFTYNVMYTELNDPMYQVDGSSQKKYSVMHYLGINFSSKFQLGVYDDVIFYKSDTNIYRGFDVQYLNPIIFMRPTEFAIGSPDNAFIGLTLKYKLSNKGFLYGQVGIDDLHITTSFQDHENYWSNKYALQLGIWNKDVFNVKGLSWRLEWDGVRPYTYTHGFDKPGINYAQDNQSLTDPFGANFHEFISIFQYQADEWYINLENLFTIRGEQPPGLSYPIGYNIFAGDLTTFPNAPQASKTLQGIKNNYFYNEIALGYVINPKNRLCIELNGTIRSHTAPGVSIGDDYFSLGIKTGLYNFYKDF